MDAQDKKEIVDLLAAAFATHQSHSQDVASEVLLAELKKDVEQLQKEMKLIWDWKKENEAVLSWARNFMDTYRNTVRIVVASGAITTIGLLIQVYYMLSKGK
jgi:hypothetical protein